MSNMKLFNSVVSVFKNWFGAKQINDIEVKSNEIQQQENRSNILKKEINFEVNQLAKQPQISSNPNITWNFMRIYDDKMLTDNEIYAALDLLKKQFSHKKNLNGFYDPQAMNAKNLKKFQFYIEYPKKFIQILHDGDKHWFTISNLNSTSKYQIHAYDSYFMNNTYIDNQKFKSNFKKLLFPPNYEINNNNLVIDLTNDSQQCEIECIIEPVQKQSNTTLCGLFAIAFAYDLCEGFNPVYRNYDESKMRAHLLKCLEQKFFEEFPRASHMSNAKCAPRAQIIYIDCK